MPAPKMLTIIGSTTVKAKAVAIAASTALPPRANVSNPAAEASGWLAATTTRDATTSSLLVVNCVPARARQVPVLLVMVGYRKTSTRATSPSEDSSAPPWPRTYPVPFAPAQEVSEMRDTRRITRRTMVAIGGGLPVGVLVAACGGSGDASSQKPAASAKPAKVVLRTL